MFINNLLHIAVDELIEGVQLLSDQTLLLEECRDDCPCIFLQAFLESLRDMKSSHLSVLRPLADCQIVIESL